MNNKKGFTLVELIATVLILAIIAIISIVAFSNINKTVKHNEYNSLYGTIKSSSYNYYEATRQTRFYVQTLIDYGILSTDNTGEITNPLNNDVMNCYIVNVSDNNFELKENSDCEKDLYEFIRPIVTYCDGSEYNPNIWHGEKNVCLTAKLPDELSDVSIKEIVWGNKNDGNYRVVSNELKLNFSDNTIVENVYTVKIDTIDENITIALKEIPLKNDLKKPVIEDFYITSETGYEYNSIHALYSIKASDEKSGVKYLCHTETNNPSTCEWIEVSDDIYSANFIINKDEGSGDTYTLYAFAKDVVGNISDVVSYKYRLYKLCDIVRYEQGTICSKTCGGTYNRLAYDKYIDNQRCRHKDLTYGGAACNSGTCNYTITYNANGGTSAPQNGTKEKGKTYIISSSIPVRNGYSFMKWTTKIDGSGTSYLPNSTYNTDADLTLYAQWDCTKEYKCSNDGNFLSKCVNDSTWTATGEKCTKECTATKCSKSCGGGSMKTICRYEYDDYYSDDIITTSSCNTNSCSIKNFDCKVQGKYITDTKKYDRLRNPWKCDSEDTSKHIKYQQHTTAYIHYCCLIDSNGKTLLDKDNCYRKKEMGEKFNITTANYVCSCKPYNNTKGWKILDDYWIPEDKRGLYETDCK